MAEITFLPFNFGGLPEELSKYETSRVVILPVPYDATCSYRAGTREGPRAIINASRNVELFDEELLEYISLCGIHTLPELFPEVNTPEKMVKKVYEAAKKILEDGKMLVTLGGEHTISLGTVKAIVKKHPKVSILQIDAHLDLRESYAGTPYNHACVMRRIQELCNIVQVGIRNFSQEEYEFVKAKGFEPFYASQMRRWLDWAEVVLEKLSEEVYITIDLDGLDPSIMPSVGTPEPGGLGWYETLELLRRVAEKRQVVAFDVMELCPNPTEPSSDFLAAKLVYKLIGYINRSRAKNPF